MKEEMDHTQAELSALHLTEENLGKKGPETGRGGLDPEVAEVNENIELYRKKDETQFFSGEMENQSEKNNIDEVIVSTAPLFKRILSL